MLSDETIQGILEEEKDPQAAADRLIEGAVDEGGIDNVTAVVIDVVEADGEGPPPGTTREAEAPSEREVTRETGPPLDVTGVRAKPPDDTTGVMRRPKAEATGVATRPRDETGVLIARPPLLEPEAKKRRWPKRVLLWGVIPAVILSGAGFGARVWIDSQFFVGVHEDRVALFRGVPSEILGYELFTLLDETELPAARIEQLGPWREIRDGITAGSEEEARDLIQQMRQDLEEANPPDR
jgi:protein phosphatase